MRLQKSHFSQDQDTWSKQVNSVIPVKTIFLKFLLKTYLVRIGPVPMRIFVLFCFVSLEVTASSRRVDTNLSLCLESYVEARIN